MCPPQDNNNVDLSIPSDASQDSSLSFSGKWKKMQEKFIVGYKRLTTSSMDKAYMLCLTNFFVYMGVSITAPIFPRILQDRGFSTNIATISYSVCAGALMIGTIFGKACTSLLGIRGSLISSFIVLAISNFGFSFLDYPAIDETAFSILTYVTRSLEGFASGIYQVAALSLLVTTYTGSRLENAFGITECAGTFGLAIGPILGNAMFFTLPRLYAWQITFISFGAIVCIFGLIVSVKCVVGMAEFKKPALFCLKEFRFYLDARSVFVAFNVFLAAMGFSCIEPILEEFLEYRHGVQGIAQNLSFGCYSLGVLTITILLIVLKDGFHVKLSSYIMMFVGIFTMAIAYFIIGPAPGLPITLTLAATNGCLFMLGVGYAIAYIGTVDPLDNIVVRCGFNDHMQASTMVASYWAFWHAAGEFVGPLYISFVDDVQDFPLWFAILAKTLIACIIVMNTIYLVFKYVLGRNAELSKGEIILIEERKIEGIALIQKNKVYGATETILPLHIKRQLSIKS